jgi:hypothetical protein
MMKYLEKNCGMKPDDIVEYLACNMDLSSKHGIWLQLAEGARKVKRRS